MLLKALSGILAFLMFFSPFGMKTDETDAPEKPGEGIYVTVAADGSGMFASIEEARDYIRTLDKTKFCDITVKLLPGVYSVTEPLTFTEEDGGTETCPVNYVGGEGVILTGGATFTSADFSVADGEIMQYVREDVRGNIVMIDLARFGFTKDDAAAIYTDPETGNTVQNINGHIPTLYAGGKLATICRYPNDRYAQIDSGKINSPHGAADARDLIDTTTVIVADEFAEEMNTWHDISKVFVRGRFSLLWCDDNSRIISLDGKTMTLPFAGGYDPRDGMFFYCQNAPEMLDAPGEYYVDDNAVLYYVKDENFDGELFTLPVAETVLKVDGADYITFSEITIESAKGDIVTVNADNVTFDGCEVRDSGEWIVMKGNGITVKNCYFHSFSNGILNITGGDWEKLISSENVIENCEFTNWGILGRVYNEAIRIDKACGVTVRHNEIHDTPHMAIGWTGTNNVVEYNEIYDVCNDTDDAGAVYSYNGYCDYGNLFRYNYIHDIGAKDEVIMNVKDYPYCHVSGIYWDGGKSGQTAQYNILENISGAGVIGSGRDEVVTNNLFISCGFGVDMSAWYYNGTFSGTNQGNGGGISHQGFAGQENNAAWQKAFPSLYRLNWNMSEADPDDPNYFVAPAGNKVLNNYFYFDKANVKSLKGYGHMFQNSIDNAVKKFCGADIEECVEGVNQTTYSSKRTTIDVREAIEETSAITGITLEEFEKIGRK